MHVNKVLHRDIKTQNIFLLGNGRLVLGDLGISKARGRPAAPLARVRAVACGFVCMRVCMRVCV
jgi:serine/threonine protein kinase